MLAAANKGGAFSRPGVAVTPAVIRRNLCNLCRWHLYRRSFETPRSDQHVQRGDGSKTVPLLVLFSKYWFTLLR
jgi:hypothetical protein